MPTVYGPALSWRLDRSLGTDLTLPPRTDNFSEEDTTSLTVVSASIFAQSFAPTRQLSHIELIPAVFSLHELALLN